MTLGVVVTLLAGGCATLEEVRIDRRGSYRQWSECLYGRLAAGGEKMDLSVFTCSRSAVLARADGEIRVTSLPDGVPDGAMVRVTTAAFAGFAEALSYCEQATGVR